MSKIKQYHVGVAAEAFAAGLLAYAECDVFVQYGANQPGYDLTAVKDDKTLKVSVKGSQDGAWGLTQSYIKNADYHRAIDKWHEKHLGKRIIFMLVQFQNVNLGECPRAYLATPIEIATQLKASSKGRGETVLFENHTWAKTAYGYGTTDKLPDEWVFSMERLDEMFKKRLASSEER